MGVDEMLDHLLAEEGGFVNNRADKGGPTNYGITLKTLATWRGHPVIIADVKQLTVVEAREIYTKRYYLDAQVDKLPARLQPPMFDACVNHGPANAWRMMQQACNALGAELQTDGEPGPKTFLEIGLSDESELLALFNARRRAFYMAIVERDPSQGIFLKGWLNRLDGMRG